MHSTPLAVELEINSTAFFNCKEWGVIQSGIRYRHYVNTHIHRTHIVTKNTVGMQ